jgi:hypothetical protein
MAFFIACLAKFRSWRTPRPIGIHRQTLHETLEHSGHGIEIGRRGENKAIGGFDPVDQGLHAIILNACSRCLARLLGALTTVAAELDGEIAQMLDFDLGARRRGGLHRRVNCLIDDAVRPIGAIDGEKVFHHNPGTGRWFLTRFNIGHSVERRGGSTPVQPAIR